MFTKSLLFSSFVAVALSSLALSLLTLSSCGDDGGDNQAAGADAADAVNICAETPSRLIVLGDSITACVGVSGKDGGSCGPKIFHESLAAGYAPGLAYENMAVSGAVTKNVPNSQLNTVTTGPGHALVLIYVGGNDIQQYLLQTDQAADTGLRGDLPELSNNWRSIFAFFNDPANFPDGATIIMNNQYNPFDNCTRAPYNLSAAKASLLNDVYNAELAILADEVDNVTLTDQYTSYLGHGHHYDDDTCPHYVAGSTPFMNDLIHPNAEGHANLAAQWSLVADGLYSDCE